MRLEYVVPPVRLWACKANALGSAAANEWLHR